MVLMADTLALPSLPVSALSLQPNSWLLRGDLDIVDLDDDTLAGLVHLRLRLQRAHGWWVLGGIFAAMASVLVVGLAVDSRLTFGAYAAAVASGTVGLGMFASWLQGSTFRRQARRAGLADVAADRLFVTAADADHWLEVIKQCGLTVSASDVASFVRQR